MGQLFPDVGQIFQHRRDRNLIGRDQRAIQPEGRPVALILFQSLFAAIERTVRIIAVAVDEEGFALRRSLLHRHAHASGVGDGAAIHALLDVIPRKAAEGLHVVDLVDRGGVIAALPLQDLRQ